MTTGQRQAKTIDAVLTPVFQDFCTSFNLDPFTIAADKHGSLVWETIWRDSLRRSVMLAVTEISAVDAEAEVWFGADQDDHFIRKLFGTLLYETPNGDIQNGLFIRDRSEVYAKIAEDNEWSLSDISIQLFQKLIKDWLRMGFYESVSLQEKDLTESYPFPRE